MAVISAIKYISKGFCAIERVGRIGERRMVHHLSNYLYYNKLQRLFAFRNTAKMINDNHSKLLNLLFDIMKYNDKGVAVCCVPCTLQYKA